MFDILFVDADEGIHSLIYTYKLEEKTNFRVKRFAKSAIEALGILEKESFDIVITDIKMPVMDGFELLEKIKKNDEDIKVIILSKHSKFEYVRTALRLGATDYIVKPITEESLIESLNRIELNNKIRVKHISDKDIDKIYFDTMNFKGGINEIEEVAQKIADEIGKRSFEEYQAIIEGVTDRIKENFDWIDNTVGLDLKIDTENIDQSFKMNLTEIIGVVAKFKINKQNNMLNNICRSIVDNICENNIFDIVSDEAELSKDYIGRLFKKAFSMTFNEYVSNLKMEYAKHLLRDSRLKIYEVSDKIGYKSVDYFCRLFKNYTNITPMQYRKEKIINIKMQEKI